MTDLLRQFFSFEKFMKDRLVVFFFFVGLIVIVLSFLGTLLNSFAIMGDGHFIKGLTLFLGAFIRIVLLFVGLRLICELMIAIFHINNNLSPDGGKSDLAELDPVEAAREIAQKAAKTASSTTKTVVEKTRSRFSDDDDEPDGEDVYPDYEDPTPPKRARKKPAAKKPAAQKAPAKSTTTKTAAKKAPAKKTTTRKTAATTKKTTTAKKTATKKPARKVTPKK
ncbi:MAG: DUF4282 domain-containing protein [Hyphomonadaceae bacterium]|nr:DUF4282 domain-containing protein [Hyphomonadaceae bacterium]